jgi:hypothetical protein
MPTFTMTVPVEKDGFVIELPFDVRAEFGKARPPVVVTVNGYTYRSTVAVMNGVSLIPFRRSNREAAHVTVGDDIQVRVELDTEPRVVEPPADLLAALEREGLLPAYRSFSFTQQREWAEGVAGAKREQTRERRIALCLEAVSTRR